MLDSYKGNIFYFVPMYNASDKEQYRLVEMKDCVEIFFFNEKKHAATMLVGNMSYIIDKSEDDLLQLHENCRMKEINKLFLFYTVPFYKAVGILKGEIKGFLIRRIGKHYNGV